MDFQKSLNEPKIWFLVSSESPLGRVNLRCTNSDPVGSSRFDLSVGKPLATTHPTLSSLNSEYCSLSSFTNSSSLARFSVMFFQPLRRATTYWLGTTRSCLHLKLAVTEEKGAVPSGGGGPWSSLLMLKREEGKQRARGEQHKRTKHKITSLFILFLQGMASVVVVQKDYDDEEEVGSLQICCWPSFFGLTAFTVKKAVLVLWIGHPLYCSNLLILSFVPFFAAAAGRPQKTTSGVWLQFRKTSLLSRWRKINALREKRKKRNCPDRGFFFDFLLAVWSCTTTRSIISAYLFSPSHTI